MQIITLFCTNVTGIGKATAAELASREANVIMACRNMELAQAAVNDIRTKTDKGNLVSYIEKEIK